MIQNHFLTVASRHGWSSLVDFSVCFVALGGLIVSLKKKVIERRKKPRNRLFCWLKGTITKHAIFRYRNLSGILSGKSVEESLPEHGLMDPLVGNFYDVCRCMLFSPHLSPGNNISDNRREANRAYLMY